uniref:Serpin domain-containing protein n=1 Tax=Timema bartmani TaxID=61472 RepID=A0A7R9EP98_9NEOP|nr:unnamed protein product [Timema bartmani]
MDYRGVLAVVCMVLPWIAHAQLPDSYRDDYNDDYDEFTPFDGERFDGFDWQLCKAIHNKEDENVVVSPIGVKLVLAMLFEGAIGNTARELMKTLQLPETRQSSRTKFSSILQSLQMTRPEYVLDIGAKLYVSENVTPKRRFTSILSVFYNTEVEQVDFSKADKTVNSINSWVNSMTHGHIGEMISQDEITSDTALLLLNAIYFKGLWRKPFPKNITAPGPFYHKSKTITTDFMTSDDYYYYSESVEYDAKIMRLPYLGKKFSMFLILPNKKDGLDMLLNTIHPALIKNQMWLMRQESVEVKLPKFNFYHTVHLKDILEELGIHEVFHNSAGLSGMAWGSNNLIVSEVMQKAGLEVNEQGTTAFGATEVNIPLKLGQSYEFHADHPFMFFIEDEKTGTVVFVGKVVNPTPSKKHVHNSNPTASKPSIEDAVHVPVIPPGGINSKPELQEKPVLGGSKPSSTPEPVEKSFSFRKPDNWVDKPLNTYSSSDASHPRSHPDPNSPSLSFRGLPSDEGISAVGVMPAEIDHISNNVDVIPEPRQVARKPSIRYPLQHSAGSSGSRSVAPASTPMVHDEISLPKNKVVWNHLTNMWHTH